MHRQIMCALAGQIVDHKNHNTLDNRRSNLRIGTQALNLLNRYPTEGCTSRYKGVFWFEANKKWVARFRKQHLGYYLYEKDAARAYNAAAYAAGGDWAYLNKIEGMSFEWSIKAPERVIKRRKSRYKGVRRRSRGSWEASLQYRCNRIVIGNYPTEDEAGEAYKRKCEELGLCR